MSLLLLSCGLKPSLGGTLMTSTGSGDLFSGNSVTLGNIFSVGATALTVNSLGLFDSGTPGFTESHSVGLWSTNGTLLAEAQFLPGMNGSSQGGFQYLSLSTSITLQPHVSYVLGASYPARTSDLTYFNDTLHYETWSPDVTFAHGRYTPDGAGYTYPAASVGGVSYVGPNLTYTLAVPEPSIWSLLVCGAGMIAVWRAGRSALSRRSN